MADALNAVRITVDQTLHGYSEGHRLIEGSVKLPQPDARTMLVLSDASGSGRRIPPDGYLTGYPLAEAGKYVLARTWAAPEMSRPGCVWTHSLLIDFPDLARLGSADELLEIFHRPSGIGGRGFGSRLKIELTRMPTTIPPHDLARAGEWAGALYGKPKGRIIGEREGQRDDKLVVALWMQQWPRLRRAFRFCSFSTDDRSTSNEVFDLQLVEGSRSSRSNVPGAILASSVARGDWIQTLLDDLEMPSGSGLRRFLRDVGSDVANGRAAMVPLIQLFEALDPRADPRRLADAVSDLELLGPGQGRMGRAAAARAIFSKPYIADRRLFDFALEQVRSDEDLLGVDASVVGRVLLRWCPDVLAEELDQADPLRRAVSVALAEATADELTAVVANVSVTAAVIITARPDILELPSFWQIGTINVPRLISFLTVEPERASRIVRAMVHAGRDDCAWQAVERFGTGPVVTALSGLDANGIRSRAEWVRAFARRTDDVASLMASGVLSHRPLLFLLTESIDPDAVPNSVGTDPWVTAVERTRTSDDVASEDLLAAFLFNRARGWRSRSAGRLFFLSVQRIHEAMAAARLSDAAWRLVGPKIPSSMWREWDRCDRLRHAVVDNFLDRDLPPIEFGTVVDDGKLWWEFVKLAAESSRGRRYLDEVRKALRNGGEPWWAERAKLIDRKVR
ncbi:hypothetical protein [Sphingomonas sp. ID0503]|uniref:GAP1-N1 domain-containing protein n=1 Tax=Sphingomonas sp. ID0503 TaxID=3399691 RepID=UPI003AFA7E59